MSILNRFPGRAATLSKSITVAAAAFFVACGGKTEPAAADVAPADPSKTEPAKTEPAKEEVKADAATPAPAADAGAAAPAADAGAAAPAADAGAAAPAGDAGAAVEVPTAFDKMFGFQEELVGIIEANKTDLDKAAAAVKEWTAKHKDELKAVIAETQKLGAELQNNPEKAMALMTAMQTKAKGLQERMEKLATENPAIKDHAGLREAMMAAMSGGAEEGEGAHDGHDHK